MWIAGVAKKICVEWIWSRQTANICEHLNTDFCHLPVLVQDTRVIPCWQCRPMERCSRSARARPRHQTHHAHGKGGVFGRVGRLSHAGPAGHAGHASHAGPVGHAGHASHAGAAGHAGHASHAGAAGHASHAGHDRSGLLEGMPRMPGPSWQIHQLQLHNLGQCFPCIAFALKPAGCFKGDECRHCHFCNAQQAKARRRQLQQAARRQKRRRGRYGEVFSCVKMSRFFWWCGGLQDFTWLKLVWFSLVEFTKVSQLWSWHVAALPAPGRVRRRRQSRVHVAKP